jgi:hypothetical protein
MQKSCTMKSLISILAFVLIPILTPFNSCAQREEVPGKIKVLIVDGFSNHDWKLTTALTKKILTRSGLFHVDVSTSPPDVNYKAWEEWAPVFANYDVVIQNSNNIENPKIQWPRTVEMALEDYVKGGGGLYIFHSANNAFAHWPEYDRMIGLGWRKAEAGTALVIDAQQRVVRIPPGEGEGTSHGPRLDTLIHRIGQHPIHAGFPTQWLTPLLEVYTYARGPAQDLTVLSYAYDEKTDKNWPIEWVVAYGDGHVYNSTFGHVWKGDENPSSLRCVGFQTSLIRALEWLATGEVRWPVPPDFPGTERVSLQP